MNSTSYQIKLDALKETLSLLDQDGIDLGTAMQAFEAGKKYKSECLDILTVLEQSIQSLSIADLSSHGVKTTDGDSQLGLEALFESLQDIEQTMDSLSDTDLETCVEQLIEAERLIQIGESQIAQLSKEMNASSSSVKGDQCV
jgi:exonuclease VII small subunit